MHEMLTRVSLQVATIFGGIAVATSLLTIMCLIFMIFLKSTTVFHICGWMQMLSGENSDVCGGYFHNNHRLQLTFALSSK